MKTAIWIVAGVLVAVTAAAAQSPHVRERDPNWMAPSRAAAATNPLAGRADVVDGGRKVFQERCTQCHGADAGGTDRGPDLLSPGVQAQSDGALFWKIGSGDTRGGMPAFSFLPKLQRWQLVLYLRSLETRRN